MLVAPALGDFAHHSDVLNVSIGVAGEPELHDGVGQQFVDTVADAVLDFAKAPDGDGRGQRAGDAMTLCASPAAFTNF